MTIAEAADAILTGVVAGSMAVAVVYGTIFGQWYARRYRWRGWRKLPERRPQQRAQPPPQPGKLHIDNIPMKCPHCGGEFGASVEIEGPFPRGNDPADLERAGWKPPLPLGERLTREKAALVARRDALAADEIEKRQAIERRLEALNRELGRFN